MLTWQGQQFKPMLLLLVADRSQTARVRDRKMWEKGGTSIFGEVPLERRVRVTVRSMSLKGVPLFPFSKYFTRYPLSSAFYTMAQLTCVNHSEQLPQNPP